MISTSSIDEAKKLIKNSTKPIIIKSQDNIFNRKILEYGKFDIFLLSNLQNKKDSIKNIDSGLNEVLAKIAAKNNISIGIDLKNIRNLDKKEKAKILTKVIQNIKICKKTRTTLMVISPKNKINASSILLTLGASTQQAKEAISF